MTPNERSAHASPTARATRPRPGGVGRRASLPAERVSDDLRRGASQFLDRRRRVAALSLAASASTGAVAAYQTGLMRRLPEPPVPLFDAARVDASGEAYEVLKTPDAALALVSYAATLAMAAAGDADRHRHSPWLPILLAG